MLDYIGSVINIFRLISAHRAHRAHRAQEIHPFFTCGFKPQVMK